MKRLMKVIVSLFTAAQAAALMVSTAHATQTWTHAQGKLVDIRILEEDRPARLYSRGWNWNPDRRYFQAFEGGHYAVELRNLTPRRVAIVMSVDGINVLNGERSSLGNREPMYVLDPYESAVIRGWRTSLDEVRQFIFVDEKVSYASRTGQANGDMGWVRIATFEEQRPVAFNTQRFMAPGCDDQASLDKATRQEERSKDEPQAGAPSPARDEPKASADSKAMARQDGGRLEARESVPGTGWGERRDDHVERTVFLAAASCTDQLIFRYEYASGLTALGIFPRESRVFARDNGSLGFARPPQW